MIFLRVLHTFTFAFVSTQTKHSFGSLTHSFLTYQLSRDILSHIIPNKTFFRILTCQFLLYLFDLFTSTMARDIKLYFHNSAWWICGVWFPGECAHETFQVCKVDTPLVNSRVPSASSAHASDWKHLISTLLQLQILPISTHQQRCVSGRGTVPYPESKQRGQISLHYF